MTQEILKESFIKLDYIWARKQGNIVPNFRHTILASVQLQVPHTKTSNGRPSCFVCDYVGHLAVACRNNRREPNNDHQRIITFASGINQIVNRKFAKLTTQKIQDVT